MKRYRYPRTWHLPWSLSLQNDDRRLPSLDVLRVDRIIVTEKMDGESTSMYRDAIHARSPDGRYHSSRAWVKALHGQIAHHIPDGYRICGENMFATHSIKYRRALGNALPSFFFGFAVFDEDNTMLSWDDSVAMFQMLDILPAPVLYDGPYDEALLHRLARDNDPNICEGYVVRDAAAMPYEPFLPRAAKFVRERHVATDKHWMTAEIIPNELREDAQCAV